MKAGLPVPYSECPELEEFHKFLNATIYRHLIHAERDELRYYKYVHCDEIDECGLPQVASVDEIIMERERLSTEEWRLEALRMFLVQPALMEKAGLTTKESIIIYKFEPIWDRPLGLNKFIKAVRWNRYGKSN